jgi:hypothetical protein
MKKQKFQLIKKYLPENILNFLRKIYTPIKYSHYSKGDFLLVQKVNKLLSKQLRNERFNRYDLIIIFIAIEQYYDKNSIGYDLYEKMQKKRMEYRGDKDDRHNTIEVFKGLLNNIEKNGFDYQSTITVDRNQHLCDGAHRLTCAIYFKVPVISVKVLRTNSDITYGIDWFRNYHFNSEELEIMKNKGEEILSHYGITMRN